MKIQKLQRPLIDRPRYVAKSPNVVNVKPNNNKPVNKKNPNKQRKRKVVNKEILEQQMQKKQMQQPVSGSVNLFGEDIKNKPPTKSKPSIKRKTKKSSKPSRRIEKPKKDDGGMFKQMKEKFIGKSKDEGVNKDN